MRVMWPSIISEIKEFDFIVIICDTCYCNKENGTVLLLLLLLLLLFLFSGIGIFNFSSRAVN